jgi:hypothetical protein
MRPSCMPGMAPVAQRIRALVFGTRCRGFESLRERLRWAMRTGLMICASAHPFFLWHQTILSGQGNPSSEKARNSAS